MLQYYLQMIEIDGEWVRETNVSKIGKIIVDPNYLDFYFTYIIDGTLETIRTRDVSEIRSLRDKLIKAVQITQDR